MCFPVFSFITLVPICLPDYVHPPSLICGLWGQSQCSFWGPLYLPWIVGCPTYDWTSINICQMKEWIKIWTYVVKSWHVPEKSTFLPFLRLKRWSALSLVFILTSDFVPNHWLIYFKTVLNLLWNASLFHPLRNRCYFPPPFLAPVLLAFMTAKQTPSLIFLLPQAVGVWSVITCE